MNDLNAQILTAHADGNLAALVTLYTLAADHSPDDQAKRFFLTHAYVYALELGHPNAPALQNRLNAFYFQEISPPEAKNLIRQPQLIVKVPSCMPKQRQH